MSALDESYKAYTARRALRMRRQTLDCGCPNDRDTYSHILCDRLACKLHADDEHECSVYGGAKDGTEEESEPAEAASEPVLDYREVFATAEGAPAMPWVQCDTSPWVSFADVAAGPADGGTAAVDVRRRVQDGTAPAPDRVADAFRAEVIRQGLSSYSVDGVPYVVEEPPPLARFWICPRCRTYGTRTARLKALHEADCDEPPVDAAPDPDPAPTRSKLSELAAALRARARRGGR